ncbi:MAG: iron-sulfur cluster assembly scaffold protein [Methanoculleus sp.]|jgi:nitrogen fixation NifU-like protein|nr:iron-sulfur cluster assembly scaffold protein [Methanoculleus sp. YWC-01]MCK9298884.1 iron-sulfur cluster assembly scaffold protein [Methanoculleus sp.]PKL57445.1 MAG: iron-sulfur cluster assembly scaffold protein [Methanomicrobiales archaeon HGW-Methanomicrobiales-6]
MYTEKVITEFTNPQYVGELADADGVGEVGSPTCGDIMRIYLKVEEDRIVDARFQTFGCAAAIASSSMATRMIRDLSLSEAWDLSNADVVDALGGLPAGKVHCSVLARDAVRAAINDYRTRRGLEPWEAGPCECCGGAGCGSHPENG